MSLIVKVDQVMRYAGCSSCLNFMIVSEHLSSGQPLAIVQLAGAQDPYQSGFAGLLKFKSSCCDKNSRKSPFFSYQVTHSRYVELAGVHGESSETAHMNFGSKALFPSKELEFLKC